MRSLRIGRVSGLLNMMIRLWGGEDVEDEDWEGVRRVRRLSWGQLGMGGGRVEHVTDGPDHYWDHFCEHLSRLNMKADDITWYQEKLKIIPFWKATFEKSQPRSKLTKRSEQRRFVTKKIWTNQTDKQKQESRMQKHSVRMHGHNKKI